MAIVGSESFVAIGNPKSCSRARFFVTAALSLCGTKTTHNDLGLRTLESSIYVSLSVSGEVSRGNCQPSAEKLLLCVHSYSASTLPPTWARPQVQRIPIRN